MSYASEAAFLRSQLPSNDLPDDPTNIDEASDAGLYPSLAFASNSGPTKLHSRTRELSSGITAANTGVKKADDLVPSEVNSGINYPEVPGKINHPEVLKNIHNILYPEPSAPPEEAIKTDISLTDSLHLAADKGDITTIRELIARGASIHRLTANGQTVLHIVIQKGNVSLLTPLIKELGVDVNAQDNTGSAAIHYAAELGKDAVVNELLKLGANPRAVTNQNLTALHLAAAYSHPSLMKIFTDRGIAVDARNKQGWTALHAALLDGNEEVVNALLKLGADPNAITNDSHTTIHLAVFCGHSSLVKVFIDRGVVVDARDKNGWTALHAAVAYGRNEAVNALLPLGADPKAITNDSRTVLHLAAANEYPSLMKIFTDRGVAVDARDKDGWTALHYAVRHGKNEAVNALLALGADPRAITNESYTAIHLAAANGHPSLIKIFTDRGINADARDKDGWTALHLATRYGRNEAVNALLTLGADPNAIANVSYTAIHLAAANGHPSLMKIFTDRGVAVDARDKNGWTALHHAVRYGKGEAVNALLTLGADPKAITNDSRTTLHLAAQFDHPSLMKIFTDRGVAVDARDDPECVGIVTFGWTALHYAVQNGKSEAVKTLLTLGADPKAITVKLYTVLHLAAANGHISFMKTFTERGIALEAKDKDGWTALHYAVRHGKNEAVNALLALGADPRAITNESYTAIHLAAANGHPSLMKIFTDRGINADARDKDGWTALHYAVRHGKNEAVNALLTLGADPKAITNDSRTVLHLAAANEYPSLMKIFTDRGVAVDARDKDGWTALHYAAILILGKADTLKELLKLGADPKAVTNSGEIALDLAIKTGEVTKVELLVLKEADINKFKNGQTFVHHAAKLGHAPIIQVLKDNGALLDLKTTPDGLTPFDLAADSGHVNAVKTLVDVRAKDRSGFTLLHQMVLANRAKAVATLLKAGAEIDAPGPDKNTAVVYALNKGYIDIAIMLIKAGANVNLLDALGHSILHFLIDLKNFDILKIAIDYGANIDQATDKHKNTPLHKAVKGQFTKAVALLVSCGANVNSVNVNSESPLQKAVSGFTGDFTIIKILLKRGATILAAVQKKLNEQLTNTLKACHDKDPKIFETARQNAKTWVSLGAEVPALSWSMSHDAKTFITQLTSQAKSLQALFADERAPEILTAPETISLSKQATPFHTSTGAAGGAGASAGASRGF